MTETTEGAVQTDAMDTAAVLAHASGDKTYVSEPKTEDPPGDDTAAAPEGEPAEPEGDEPPAKARKQTAQERIDELTRDKHAERRAREAAEQRLAEIEARAAPVVQPAPAEGTGRPDPDAFDGGAYDPKYIEALTDWKAEQAVSRLLSQREGQAQFKTALSTFEQKVKDAYPDGEPAGISALRRAPNLPQTVFDIVTASDIGPKLADHLGNNPSEYQRLLGLAPHLQGHELARLEQRLATPPAPTPKTATDAPEPAPTVRGAGGRFTVAADTNDFSAFEKQYLGGS